VSGPLSGCDVPVPERYDVALLDLDGVVYLGGDGIPGAAEALAKVRDAGLRCVFVTNNASRSPEEVAALLTRLGVPADAEDVVTSAQAAAHVLADRLPAGAKVLVVGTGALAKEVARRGLTPVDSADDDPEAVVQGYSPDLSWRQLAEAAVAIRRGALWVATNLDLTVPSARGPLPGNGSLVRAVQGAAETEPLVTGKPEPAMHRELMERTGARRPLIVGDRLDTDIEGANRAGVASLLVLTGVTTPADLLAAGPLHRPTHLAAGLADLLVPEPRPRREPSGAWACGGFVVTETGEGMRLSGGGDRPVDALRALCAACWEAADATRPGEHACAPAGPRRTGDAAAVADGAVADGGVADGADGAAAGSRRGSAVNDGRAVAARRPRVVVDGQPAVAALRELGLEPPDAATTEPTSASAGRTHSPAP
jgi:HAD superfamily hydrolase (TIGR01450 family)